MVDIPGTYSLMAHSVEEEVARDFICFGDPDAVVVVCDATCLERNMNLVLQTLEITDRVVVCVNLMDEARKKHIEIDFGKLSENLGVPVVGASARSREGLDELDGRRGTCGGERPLRAGPLAVSARRWRTRSRCSRRCGTALHGRDPPPAGSPSSCSRTIPS